ncbi:MAG: hypothetical protein JKY71_01045 [Alphaproteobacteria bacterium]|nr:hypothetical protein [Alphaproteobacteria bacterium]
MNAINAQSLSLHFSPVIDQQFIIVLAILGAVTIALKIISVKKLPLFRLITFAAFIFLLCGPSIHEEQREGVSSIAVIIVDESASQSFGERAERTEQAVAYLERTLGEMERIETRVINGPRDGKLSSRTNLFATLEEAFADVPESRRAGVFIITDGQIHDMPPADALEDRYGPVHVLLNGEKNEVDRRIVLTNAPAYGIVGQDIRVEFKIEDSGTNDPNAVTYVTLRRADGTTQRRAVRVGEIQTMTLPVEHAGQNVFAMTVEPLAGELTERNNSVAIDFQGVRDRLRVLLVSGKPHAGGRTWRDLLKADPSVDLVHFTILREPDKIDATPQREMSLIAFPFRELFELKLYDFDLIIFDRYRVNRILPDHYFKNISRYVEEGGAFLEASGPAFASDDSIYYTGLRGILPAEPTGEVLDQSFVPTISERGNGHPVTRALQWTPRASNESSESWGEWNRQIGLSSVTGDTLMTGVREQPLLVLKRIKDGRVAQIASDHIWLWARGYDGGGPHAELLRRTVHWLMKEPELDEQALDVKVDGQTLIIQRAAYEREQDTVTMTKPSGETEELTMLPNNNGVLEKLHRANETGIYKFETADRKLRYVVVGEVDPPEFRNVLTSGAILEPLTELSEGGMLWLSENASPAVNLRTNGPFAGRDWLAVENTNAYAVTGASEEPFLPLWASLLILLSLTVATWFFEGRKAI